MIDPHGPRPRRLAFFSSNDVWGGSEELWSAAAAILARRGHAITVCKPRIDYAQSRIVELTALGATIVDTTGPRRLPRKVRSLIYMAWHAARRMTEFRISRALRSSGAELAIISQGLNYDGWLAASVCRRFGVPYVMISQKATDMYWPPDHLRAVVGEIYTGARAAYFVSDHNLRLTEEQLAIRLVNASVVRNPFQVAWEPRNDWPDEEGGLRFACVARLDVREKGQDMLLRVLAQDKWRAREFDVRFFGSGHNREGLEAMASLLDLKRVSFAGFTTRPDAIWDDHHGLILPSHCEGLPLTLVEAMLSARVSIVTPVGGNAEVLSDGQTGFITASASEGHLDEALERAWARRAEWRAIGQAASARIRQMVPPNPSVIFAEKLLELL
ncbi:MAG: glycosyltransferase [Sphingomonas bacterium]|uniref:glycosyltransferase family 4 protein n=1 Tax=Sphingomonas bacterium TaxID=1895847 RepID=UPI002627BC75|nr:glycosyltransferase family 4 protein [Sphingomonas bacterium]MDB5705311.1 glycosyltransferase [Sphingomonas bacterium]